MKKIFISYKRINKNRVFKIVEDIRRTTGIDCWIDLSGIESGDWFENTIIRAINECDILLFMLSKESIAVPAVGESWTQREVKFALKKGKRVVPILIDGTTIDDCDWLSFNCSGLDCIDIDNTDQTRKLYRNLKEWCGVSVDSIPPNRYPPKRQTETSQSTPFIGGTQTTDIINLATPDTLVTSEEMKLCNTYIDMVIHMKWTRIEETKRQVETLAIKGKTEAEYALGFGAYYHCGPNISESFNDENYRLAEQWLLKAAKKDHTKAQNMLVDMYYWRKEYVKATPWAIVATNKGQIDAARILAWCYKKQNDIPKYIEAIRKAAQMQASSKQKTRHNPALELAMFLYMHKDLDEAIRWYDVAIAYSHESHDILRAKYYKGCALYEQGHKWKALMCLKEVSSKDSSASRLCDKIKSEFNPFSKLFK